MINGEIFVERMKTPFKYKKENKPDNRRYLNPQQLVQKVIPQILEMIDQDLPYSTPEDWDSSFDILGGTRSRYKSITITSKMTWEQFLYLSDIALSNSEAL